MISIVNRPLSQREVRRLKREMKAVALRQRAANRRGLPYHIAGFGLLWLLTMFVSDISWDVITGFWVIVGGVIYIWNSWSINREFRQWISNKQKMLDRNTVQVVRIQSVDIVEFEEIEDEGACYGFQVEPRKVVFVVGQDFYSTANFPNSDFELVYSGDSGKTLIQIANYGIKVAPGRVISSQVKMELRVPEHLEVVEADIASIEPELALPRSND